ncbi:hypothetical protein CJ195_15880 [Bacillus sp. UMB0899]|nr:hypothetical protein CJ195_15880 [Bacillus sp. UMB0899]
MPKEKMKMSIEEIKNAMINPDFVTHLHGLKISNQWGDIEGRQLILDVYRLCEKYTEIEKELSDIKNR